MATVLGSTKTKIARRVIEIFEFFDRHGQSATVTDIVRRYGRPQSSTSELLTSLAEMGLLYKDPRSRSYSPTPRLATIGAAAQPGIIRDGRLFAFMDRLSHSSRHAVALFGMVGTHAQVFRWFPGENGATQALGSGSAEYLSSTVAGLLLLSTMTPDQSRRMLWRLNGEAAPAAKFDLNAMTDRIAAYRRAGHASGAAGFAPGLNATVASLPSARDARPLVLGILYPADAGIDADALAGTLRRGISQCAKPEEFGLPSPALSPVRIAG